LLRKKPKLLGDESYRKGDRVPRNLSQHRDWNRFKAEFLLGKKSQVVAKSARMISTKITDHGLTAVGTVDGKQPVFRWSDTEHPTCMHDTGTTTYHIVYLRRKKEISAFQNKKI
jgi:hypothetical protein